MRVQKNEGNNSTLYSLKILNSDRTQNKNDDDEHYIDRRCIFFIS